MTKQLGKFGGWGGYAGERSHYWTWTYGVEESIENKPRRERDFRWHSFCGEATGGPDPYDDAPDKRPSPKRAGKCYACYQFQRM